MTTAILVVTVAYGPWLIVKARLGRKPGVSVGLFALYLLVSLALQQMGRFDISRPLLIVSLWMLFETISGILGSIWPRRPGQGQS
ncbi:MAG: hypothetical protein AB1331_00210 [Bacillota bacterium]